MILTLFLALLALAVVVAFMGYFTGDEPYLTIGLFFLFLLSFVIIGGSLQYQTGLNVTNCDYSELYVYGNNFTGYHWDYDAGTAPDGPQTGAYLFHMNRTYEDCVSTTTFIYSSWNDTTSHGVGWGLAVISFLGVALSLYNTSRRRREREE